MVRPHGDDLSDPLLAELAEELARDPESRRVQEKLQRFDAAVGRALQNAPLPPGLSERVLSALAAAASDASSPLLDAPTPAGDDASLAEVLGPHAPLASAKRSRRWTLWACLGAGSTMVAASAALLYLFRAGHTRDGLLAAGRESFARLNFDAADWQDRRRAPASAPFSTDLEFGAVTGWRTWSDLDGLAGVVYKLRAAPVNAALFQFAEPLGLPTDFPTSPSHFENTQDLQASAWAKNGSLYVFVIHATERQARTLRYFRKPVQVT